jgi:hypothetical protein
MDLSITSTLFALHCTVFIYFSLHVPNVEISDLILAYLTACNMCLCLSELHAQLFNPWQHDAAPDRSWVRLIYFEGWGRLRIWIYRQAVHLPIHYFIIRRIDDLQRAVVSGISDITPGWNKKRSITYYVKIIQSWFEPKKQYQLIN